MELRVSGVFLYKGTCWFPALGFVSPMTEVVSTGTGYFTPSSLGSLLSSVTPEFITPTVGTCVF